MEIINKYISQRISKQSNIIRNHIHQFRKAICNSNSKAPSSRLPIYNNQIYLTPTPSIALHSNDKTYIPNKTNTETINKVEQKKTTKVSLPISLAKRTRLEIKETSRTIRTVDKVNNQYLNKQLTKRKHRTEFRKRDNNNKFQIKLSKPQAQKLKIQCKLTSMNDENDNLTFGNNINDHDKSSARILFVNQNGVYLCIDDHRLIELLNNSKQKNINILLLTETNTHWKNKRSTDSFRKTITQYWKGAAVTTSEMKLNKNVIYKPGGIAIIAENSVRSRKVKSREDSHSLGRWSYMMLQGR